MMSDKHIVISQSSMQYLPTRLPITIFQKVEEQLSAVREGMVGAVRLCGDKRFISSYSRVLYGPMNKMFSWDLVLLSFSVVSDFEADFFYLLC